MGFLQPGHTRPRICCPACCHARCKACGERGERGAVHRACNFKRRTAAVHHRTRPAVLQQYRPAPVESEAWRKAPPSSDRCKNARIFHHGPAGNRGVLVHIWRKKRRPARIRVRTCADEHPTRVRRCHGSGPVARAH
ncbi:hypothetical protein TPACW86_0487 [Treponema pallidum subsp. pallidum]|nr:hypothetical protein TPAMA_0487 [Treponema pallidum subsp. pallidum str. Mexico A]AGN75678.1 hypothetical protein TPANIC_0487 [Treponema pallidum subsp. pallidum str. Nichols]AGN76654.1 hypothetical protein TPASS_20487 [Treponema pallidum subsp. pallidum SS14]AVW88509.1 hypothetical protein TPAUZ1974_0487 [Treponema pallidum subsp. pallidum]QCP88830.1 hypothetical protein TPACW30_0487 [Treponema pallidum subsp. pallidum]